MRYEVSVTHLLESFKALTGATVSTSIDVAAFAWAYKMLSRWGAEVNSPEAAAMMARLETMLGGLGHE